MGQISTIRQCVSLLKEADYVALPDNVLRTANLLLQRGIEDDLSDIVSKCLTSFCASRNLCPLPAYIDAERLNRALHEWFADPSAERLREVIHRQA